MRKGLLATVALVLAACASLPNEPPVTAEPVARHAFFANMRSLCGNTYAGEVVSTDAVDAEWRASELVLGPVDCEGDLVSLPLRVGADTSRTWFLRRNPYGLAFHHQHLLSDGSPDPVSMYGGAATGDGTALRQSFPADRGSKIMFEENGLEPSVANVWSLTLELGDTLTYALARPGRDFRAEFDIAEPASSPGGD